MAYQLLTGHLPFHDDSNIGLDSRPEIVGREPNVERLFGSIVNDPIPYVEKHWEQVSSDAKALVNSLLQKNPSERISAKEALQSPWIRRYSASMQYVGGSDSSDAEADRVLWGDVMARLQMFAQEDTRRKQLLRDAAGTRLAEEDACELVREGRFICSASESGPAASQEQGEGMVHSHDDVLAELIELFTEMDEDDDGLLTWREIWALLDRGGYHVSQAEIDQLMPRIGRDGDAKVSIQDFVAAFPIGSDAQNRQRQVRATAVE